MIFLIEKIVPENEVYTWFSSEGRIYKYLVYAVLTVKQYFKILSNHPVKLVEIESAMCMVYILSSSTIV